MSDGTGPTDPWGNPDPELARQQGWGQPAPPAGWSAPPSGWGGSSPPPAPPQGWAPPPHGGWSAPPPGDPSGGVPPLGWGPPGAAPGPWVGPPRRDGQAIGSLVTGIVSLACPGVIGIFLGITAIALGAVGLRRIKASEGALDGRGMALAGLILGSIGTVLGTAAFIYVTFINPDYVADLLEQMTTTTSTPR